MRLDRAWLLVLAGLALALLVLTPRLIVPFSAQGAWYESPAMFPRAGLALVVVGALAEWWRRRRAVEGAGGEELDSSAADLARAALVVLLFGAYALAVPRLGFATASVLFLLVAGRTVGLGWRASLALAVPLALAMWLAFVVLLKVAFGHGLLF